MDVKDDTFVHFTTLKRAQKILDSKKLLLDSPYAGMGVYGVFAISLTYGELIPGVQTTHIKKDSKNDKIVAVKFKTNTIPKKYGSVDEVAFGEQDVNLISPEIISEEKATNIIKNSPVNLSKNKEDGIVIYDKSLIKDLNIVSKKASYNTLNKYFKLLFEKSINV